MLRTVGLEYERLGADERLGDRMAGEALLRNDGEGVDRIGAAEMLGDERIVGDALRAENVEGEADRNDGDALTLGDERNEGEDVTVGEDQMVGEGRNAGTDERVGPEASPGDIALALGELDPKLGAEGRIVGDATEGDA